MHIYIPLVEDNGAADHNIRLYAVFHAHVGRLEIIMFTDFVGSLAIICCDTCSIIHVLFLCRNTRL